MGRSPCCSKVGLRRGPWSTKEDSLLADFIRQNGEGQWRSLPKKAGLLRCGKSCRLRWMNYLRPGIKRGNITQDEEDLIVRLHALLGNRWSLIAGRLPGRTDNEIKNYWNTHLLKKLKTAGLDPTSPKPKKPAAGMPKKKNKNKKALAKVDTQEMTVDKADTEEMAAAVPEAAPPLLKEEVSVKSKEVVVAAFDPPKVKVYLPKPTRVSPGFSRTSSYDSLASAGTSSNSDAVAEAEVMSLFPWPPLFELEDAGYSGSGGIADDDFLDGGFILPVLNHSDSISSDVNMLEKVYDEYLQLL